MAPTSLCGNLITSRRSFLALAWTLTTLLSFFSFGVSVFLGMKITNQYNSMLSDDYAEWYRDEYGYDYNDGCGRYRHRDLSSNDNNDNNNNSGDQNNNNNNNNNKDGEGEDDHDRDEGCHSGDQAELDEDFFESLATTNSRGLVFAGVYTTVLGIALALYGSTVVVGFMSLKGEYIPPCFSFRTMSVIEDEDNMSDEDSCTGPRKLWGEKIHRGIFLGGLVIFSNLMLLCAVIFGELKVHDNYNQYDEQKNNIFSYRIEKISSVFAITCLVLAFFYILFAVIYTTCGGISDDDSQSIDSSSWGNRHYEMSTQHAGGSRKRRSRRGRRSMPNSMDKQEPLVGTGVSPGFTDNDGFITDMVSTSSGESIGSHPWEGGRQFANQLS